MSKSIPLVAAFVVLGGLAASAQAPVLQSLDSSSIVPAGRATFRSGIDVVTLTVTVTDKTEHAIRNLTADNFTLREDGVEQPVSFFGTADVPLDLALVIDSSASMGDKMTVLKRAATGLVRTLTPRDRVSVLEFRDVLAVDEPLTNDFDRAATTIAALRPGGTTGLYNALYVTLRGFGSSPEASEVRRRAVVVFSDGEDTTSVVSFDDVLDMARRSGVAAYVVALRSQGRGVLASGDAYSPGDYGLRQLSEQTGARAFFPQSLREIRTVYDAIATELASQYALGYVPVKAERDGAWRRLTVSVLDHPGAHTRARQGYFATPGAVLTALLHR